MLTRIPYLRLHSLPFNIDGPRGEFDSNCRLRVKVEFIACETRKHCPFRHSDEFSTGQPGVLTVPVQVEFE